jgi:hypothetical protein
MHHIWENLIPHLILLWTGKFKGLDKDVVEYQLNLKVWKAIREVIMAAGSIISSVFGSWPLNPASHKASYSAKAWSFWTLYLGPILLHQWFCHQQYYKHFIQLVKLLQMCLKFEITTEEVQIIYDGFINWVKNYEQWA